MCKKRTVYCLWYQAIQHGSMLEKLPLPEYRGGTLWGVDSSVWNLKSLAIGGGLRNFTRMLAISKPEQNGWGSLLWGPIKDLVPRFHPQTHEVHAFLWSVYIAQDSRSERLQWDLALYSPAKWPWKTLTLPGFRVFVCNTGTIFLPSLDSCCDNKTKSLQQKCLANTAMLA